MSKFNSRWAETTGHVNTLLSSYPRKRQPLSEAHQQIYAKQYLINRDGAKPVEALAQRMERWMHRRVASLRNGPILELGAGTLNHVKFEDQQITYDIVEPFEALLLRRKELSRIRSIYSHVHEVPADKLYSRCISIAVLEHMDDLPFDVARSALHLTGEGVFQAGIPSEGGFLWWLGWRGTTGISYRLRTGLDYGVIMRHEHVNNANEIISIVRYFFKEVKIARFPFPGLHASLYTYLEARHPDIVKCKEIVCRREN